MSFHWFTIKILFIELNFLKADTFHWNSFSIILQFSATDTKKYLELIKLSSNFLVITISELSINSWHQFTFTLESNRSWRNVEKNEKDEIFLLQRKLFLSWDFVWKCLSMDRWASLHLSQITGKTQAKRFKTFFFESHVIRKYESKIYILGDFILRPETFFFFFRSFDCWESV